VKALREGKPRTDNTLSAMPYPSYGQAGPRKTFGALLLMKGLSRCTIPITGKIELAAWFAFPLSVWNALYLKKGEYAAIEKKRVVESRRLSCTGLGHCGDCHTPTGMAAR